MYFMKKVLLSVSAFAFLPTLAFAQTGVPTQGIQDSVDGFGTIVNSLIPILIGIAFIAFIIGIVKYLWAGGADQKERAKSHLIWGIVSITAILAIFGIARLFIQLFDLSPTSLDETYIPQIGTPSQ